MITSFVGIVKDLVERDGWKLPVTVAAVDIAGGVFCCRYERNGDDLLMVPLAREYDGSFHAPMNCMVVDADGQAAHVLRQYGSQVVN